MNQSLWELQRVALGTRLRDVTLTIEPGVTAILGQSGAGKTSLLNLLVGFELVESGQLSAGFTRGGHALPLFWAPQDGGLWPHLTARQHLETVGTAELLEDFDLSARADCLPETLSLGERARLAVARALAADAGVLVMDEPLANVDSARVGKYWEVIRRRLAATGASLVFATHSPGSALGEARRVICLKDGRLLYAGNIEELYWRPATEELAECLGESNWLQPEEARLWLGREENVARCYRPEQVTVTAIEHGECVVESSRFCGAVAEVELRHEPSGLRRRFLHRPAMNHLPVGVRVLLKVLVALVLTMGWGCGDKAPAIPVHEFHAWVVPSDGAKLPAPRSVAIGRGDEVFALDTAGRVLVYGADGALKRQWTMPETSVGKPEGVVVLNDGRVAVSDTHYHRVVMFDSQGHVVKMFGHEGTGHGEFIYPVAITKDDHENLYVAEYGSNDRVQKFTSEGEFLASFGSFGTQVGQFQRPSGIVWHAGKVYVADAFNNRIQVFSDEGKFVRSFDNLGLRFPYDLRLGSDDMFYVIEYGAARVTKVSLDGKLVGRYGGPGAGDGQFATPWGIAIDSQMRVRVADTGNRRLVELKL
jgi:ABC-type multidrug transport system ATPase subunit